MTLLAICVSGRQGSRNRALLELAKEVCPPEISFEIMDNLSDLPLFEAPGKEPSPEPVQQIRDKIQGADAVLIATPEYIHSLPAALKNLFEWTVASGEFYEKRVAVWTAMSGSNFVLPQVLEILRTMTAEVVDEACGYVQAEPQVIRVHLGALAPWPAN